MAEIHGSLIRLYIPDHRNADEEEVAKMAKELAEIPEVIRVALTYSLRT